MRTTIFLLLILCNLNSYSQSKEITIKTDISEATVFIHGAQVIRKKTVELTAGTTQVKFSALSPYLDAKSIQVKANGEVTVLSVNHQFNFMDSLSRSKELDELNAKVKAIENKIQLDNVNQDIINEELIFIRDNRVIGGKNQEVNLTNLKETSTFYGDKMSSLKMKMLEITKDLESLNEEKAALEKQINQISSAKPSPTSEVFVKISSKSPETCELELAYFVNNAGWYPTYDIRAKNIEEPIELVYKANIHQSTKEDWKNVKLRLSSSNPNQGNVAPQLQPWFLNYNSQPPRYSNLTNQVSGKVLDGKTREAMPGVSVSIQGTTIGTVTDAQGNYSLSIPGNNTQLVFSFVGYVSQTLYVNNPVLNVFLQEDMKSLDEVVVLGYGGQRKLEGRVAGLSIQSVDKSRSVPVVQVENQTSVEFDIKVPYTVNSDNKNITVDIDNYSLDSKYEYYCAPKVDKDAFLMANISDWEKYNLLEGEANIFFENTYVGKTILEVRNISDTLKLSLGRDKNVLVKRDKIKDFTTRQFLGNKKEETKAWQITVKNNKKQPVNMILSDQVPISSNEEIEVSVDNLSGGTLNKENGEIKWNIKLDPSAKKELQLKYKVKYPKDKYLIIE